MSTPNNKPTFFQNFPDEAFRAQVEAGNITEKDIEVLNDVERRVQLYRRVGLYGGALSAAAYGRLYRQPRWSMRKTFAGSSLAAMGGVGLASIITVRTLFTAMDRLEDKQRFGEAISALRAEAVNNSTTSRPTESRTPRPYGDPVEPSAPSSEPSPAWSTSSDSTSSSTSDGSSYNQPDEGSRWSEIRSERANASSSTWDRIREQRQKADAQTKSTSSPSSTPEKATAVPPSAPGTERTKTGRSEQDEFDALLEAERSAAAGSGEKSWGESGASRWT